MQNIHFCLCKTICFAQVYVFAYAKVHTLYKTYGFAYAKYIVLRMYMVLHAATGKRWLHVSKLIGPCKLCFNISTYYLPTHLVNPVEFHTTPAFRMGSASDFQMY